MEKKKKTITNQDIEEKLQHFTAKEIETIGWVIDNIDYVKKMTNRTKMTDTEIEEHLAQAVVDEDFLKQILLTIVKKNKMEKEERQMKRLRRSFNEDG